MEGKRSIVAFVRKLGVEAGIVGKYYCKRNLNTDFFHYLWLLSFQTPPTISPSIYIYSTQLGPWSDPLSSSRRFALTLMEFLSSFSPSLSLARAKAFAS